MYTNAFLLKNGVFSIIPNKAANSFIATICLTELYFAAGLLFCPEDFYTNSLPLLICLLAAEG